MALSQSALLGLVEWCASTPILQQERVEARAAFFGDADPRPVSYWPGAGDWIGRERRFMGWFALTHVRAAGEPAGVVAARQVLRGREAEDALRAILGARFVTGVVVRVAVGSGLVLEVEDERFEVRSRELPARVSRDEAVCCHLVPAAPRRWLLGPGWVVLPFRYGAGLRDRLREFQWDPIGLERFLQGRKDEPDAPHPEPVRDATLAEAVGRMTEAARASGHLNLVLSVQEWVALVEPFLLSRDTKGFGQEMLNRLGEVPPAEEANDWFHLATNIWNNTPQPDRGGKSANELVLENPGEVTLELRSETLGR